MTEGRRLINGIEPLQLDSVALAESLQRLIDEATCLQELKVAVDVQIAPEPHPAMARLIYRTVQESIRNLCQHSQATEARITVRVDGPCVRVEVQDNGVGFDPTQIDSDRFGLRGMRRRAEAAGGSLRIFSQAGQGTRIELTVTQGG